jgi:hypothetical protein
MAASSMTALQQSIFVAGAIFFGAQQLFCIVSNTQQQPQRGAVRPMTTEGQVVVANDNNATWCTMTAWLLSTIIFIC